LVAAERALICRYTETDVRRQSMMPTASIQIQRQIAETLDIASAALEVEVMVSAPATRHAAIPATPPSMPTMSAK
jgi:hypothetical protein